MPRLGSTDSCFQLASFVHTYMEPEADKLIMENISKNLSDADEYPAMMDIHARCISMIADLWGAKGGSAMGTATTGSSEAIMLGGLAMKKRWQERRKKEGKPFDKPNCIMGANAQGKWLSCVYFQWSPNVHSRH